MENLFVRENFFSNIEKIRNIALTSKFYSPTEIESRVNWRGFRTKELSTFKNELLIESKNFILDEITKKFKLKNPFIETFFHLTYDDTKNTLDNFDNDKWHQDHNYTHAGVVYLTPNPPTKSGTSIILDEMRGLLPGVSDRGVRIDIENCYNKIFAYPSYHTHAPTDFFGDNIENGRITLTFFVSNG